MSIFLPKQPTVIKEYDEKLVRRLIEKVTVYEDRFDVVFRSDVTVDVEGREYHLLTLTIIGHQVVWRHRETHTSCPPSSMSILFNSPVWSDNSRNMYRCIPI